jgi:AcrR family transcriptional regulator
MVYTVTMKRKASVDSTGDERRRSALDLAWGWGERPRPGPRPSLKLADIVDAAVAIADAEGIEAVSMPRVAQRVGVTPMALYRYVGGKDDLVFLAVDAAAASTPPSPDPGEPWRAAVERWAHADLEMLGAHPWVVRVPMSEPPIGPNQMAWMESLLASLAGSGLSEADRLGIITLIAGYVSGHFRLYDDLTKGARARGMTRQQAEREYFETLGRILDSDRFPNAAGAFAAAGSVPATDAVEDFEFGLARILDGIEQLADRTVRRANGGRRRQTSRRCTARVR